MATLDGGQPLTVYTYYSTLSVYIRTTSRAARTNTCATSVYVGQKQREVGTYCERDGPKHFPCKHVGASAEICKLGRSVTVKFASRSLYKPPSPSRRIPPCRLYPRPTWVQPGGIFIMNLELQVQLTPIQSAVCVCVLWSAKLNNFVYCKTVEVQCKQTAIHDKNKHDKVAGYV